ncbi:acetyltransferase [Desulfurivibrio sp. D14AmB]|uniref:acetyltransferase n=1 Tax=Desulfurivibrio sp. D14AmB TaxID=3374370 RepID=UPI00376EFA03
MIEGGITVIGAGGHAKVVVATALAAGMVVDAIYDDNPALVGGSLLGVPIRGRIADLQPLAGRALILAIGDNATRCRLAARLAGAEWATVVHPRATVHGSVRLGPGCMVFAGAVIQPDSRVGAHVIVNTGAVVDHDCRIGDFAHLAPRSALAGNVRIGTGCLVGIGGVVAPGVGLGDWSVLGAGGVAIAEVGSHLVASGVPARPHADNKS